MTLERPLLESLPYSVSERQSGMFGLLHAMESVATLLLMCDGRDLSTAIGERPPSRDSSEPANLSRNKKQQPGPLADRPKGILRTKSVSVRRLSGWNRLLRTALPHPRTAHPQNPRPNSNLPLRFRLPFLRRPRRRPRPPRQRSSPRYAGSLGRVTFEISRSRNVPLCLQPLTNSPASQL